MTDILDRLGNVECDREPFTPDHAHCVCRVASAAADEITRLRDQLAGADALISCHQSAIDKNPPETWPHGSLLKAAVERHANRQ
jgi:hypothetical protein